MASTRHVTCSDPDCRVAALDAPSYPELAVTTPEAPATLPFICLGPPPPFVHPEAARPCKDALELEQAVEACEGKAILWLNGPIPDRTMHALHRRFPQLRWCCAHGHPCVDMYARTDMLQALAHSIRSPLLVLEAAADELERRFGDDSVEWDMLRRGLARYRRTAELLADVATLEAVDGAAEARDRTDVRALDVVHAAWDEARHLLPLRHEVNLDLELEPSTRFVRVASGPLGRALRELFLNARRHAIHAVTVNGESSTRHWILRIVDDGPGPGPAGDSRNWARFVSAESRGARSDLAMGLSVASDEVDRLGGRLRISSRSDGEGTLAEITWPASTPSPT